MDELCSACASNPPEKGRWGDDDDDLCVWCIKKYRCYMCWEENEMFRGPEWKTHHYCEEPDHVLCPNCWSLVESDYVTDGEQ